MKFILVSSACNDVRHYFKFQFVKIQTINDQDKMAQLTDKLVEVTEVSAQTEQSDWIASDTLRIIENSLERIVDDKLSNVSNEDKRI